MLCVVYRHWYNKTTGKEFSNILKSQAKDKKKSWVLFSRLMTQNRKRNLDDKKHHQSPKDCLWQAELISHNFTEMSRKCHMH